MKAFITDSSGIQYGLVKDHGNCTLQKAKSRISNLPMRDHPYSVHVVSVISELWYVVIMVGGEREKGRVRQCAREKRQHRDCAWKK